MKYSEYLRLVKDRLADTNGNPGPDGKRNPRAICFANSDVVAERVVAAELAQDVATARQAHAHYQRLEAAIAQVLKDIHQHLEPHHRSCMYPAALLELVKLSGGPLDFSERWAQKVRHELLDKWIAEAQQEESATQEKHHE